MQYVGKVGGYVYNQWNSLNPATLSGAIDIIVIEQPDGSLHCSPWHIRFGVFQIIKPLQKKVDLYVNGIKTDLPMKLGEGGEAFFVFEIDKESGGADLLSKSVMTSPVISAASSPPGSPGRRPPISSGNQSITGSALELNTSNEPDTLNLDAGSSIPKFELNEKIKLSNTTPGTPKSPRLVALKIAFEKVKRITQELNIPSKIDVNGDMVLDMDGYKPNSQKNIDNSDELFNKIFMEEMSKLHGEGVGGSDVDFDGEPWNGMLTKDENGNIRIIASNEEDDDDDDDDKQHPTDLEGFELDSGVNSDSETVSNSELPNKKGDKTYFKTLRLTSDQLRLMKLNYGENQLAFKLYEGTTQITSNLYLWKSTTPIVISDIDGTITKSDALGHVLNLIGRDWTHPGVANMFLDISANGYNIMYLTARSAGQADSTRQYLRNIDQEGNKLPPGPVILSPDRTMAALKREVILKKPEVFKMACLNDIKNLYFNLNEISLNNHDNNDTKLGNNEIDDDRTPFYAGFGNRITDAISYRSVGIPSHRIFTINPEGEVHMELLELAGYRSSYLHIGELVDHFFPPLKEVPNSYWNVNQWNEFVHNKDDIDATTPTSPGSPDARSMNSSGSGDDYFRYPNSEFQQQPVRAFNNLKVDERFNDVNYWRDPIPNLSDLSDEEDEPLKGSSPQPEPKSPSAFSIRSFTLLEDKVDKTLRVSGLTGGSYELPEKKTRKDRPTSMSSITSPLKSFMLGGSKSNVNEKLQASQKEEDEDEDVDDDDYTDEEDMDGDYVDEEDDYTTEEEYDDVDEEDDYEDDYEDEDEDEEGELELELDDDVDIDEELDGDFDDSLPQEELKINSPIDLLQQNSPIRSKKSQASLGLILENDPKFISASELMNNLDLNK